MKTANECIQEESDSRDQRFAAAALESRNQKLPYGVTLTEGKDPDNGWTFKEYVQGEYDSPLPSPSTLKRIVTMVLDLFVLTAIGLIATGIYSYWMGYLK